MNVLVTGGAGYIGSHTCLELLNAGHKVSVVDNLSNSSEESLRRVSNIADAELQFTELDILDSTSLNELFEESGFDAVIHFAALKAVGESVQKPLDYYQNNITGTLNICKAMEMHSVRHLVFSSSATVYGTPQQLPLTEESPTPMEGITNPYGRTKLINECVLRDWQIANPKMNVALLRYFNPVGAHESGLIGEDPNGIPNNLLPYVSQVAVGRLDKLGIFGGDYDTVDGTGVRDYIHVVDLAAGHALALEKLATEPGVVTYNLGTGKGYSVLEVVKAFEKASGCEIPYEIVDRRDGDVASCYADASACHVTAGLDCRKRDR